MKKLILVGLIFSFIVICNDTDWIERIFNLRYTVAPGWCGNVLLGLIASILILKRN